jgi:hypothetical protein
MFAKCIVSEVFFQDLSRLHISLIRGVLH